MPNVYKDSFIIQYLQPCLTDVSWTYKYQAGTQVHDSQPKFFSKWEIFHRKLHDYYSPNIVDKLLTVQVSENYWELTAASAVMTSLRVLTGRHGCWWAPQLHWFEGITPSSRHQCTISQQMAPLETPIIIKCMTTINPVVLCNRFH